jgi:hypothetical protein
LMRSHADALSKAQQAKRSVDKPVLTDADRQLLAKLADGLANIREYLRHGHDQLCQEAQERFDHAMRVYFEDSRQDIARMRAEFERRLEQKGFHKILDKLATVHPIAGRREEPTSRATRPSGPAPAHRADLGSRVRHAPPIVGDGTLTGPERKILTAIAELEVLGLYPADKQQVGLMAHYTNVRSGGFSEPLGRLISMGYVESPQAGQLTITAGGRALVTVEDAPATPREMQTRVMAKLSGPEQKLLGVLIAEYPSPMTKEDLGARCNYTNIRSGGFSEPLGRLSTLGLVSSPSRGVVKAAPALFLERV